MLLVDISLREKFWMKLMVCLRQYVTVRIANINVCI